MDSPLTAVAALLAISLVLFGVSGCASAPSGERTYSDDLALLQKHTDVIELASPDGQARIAIVPQYQGRVMTSTALGLTGRGYGWLNHEFIASGKLVPHMNAFGGEDRFWMGPEGGQFAIFFAPGKSFNLDDWQTPAVIDSEPYEVVSKNPFQIAFRKTASLTNYSGSRFDLKIYRTIRMLDANATRAAIGIAPAADVSAVAYESVNTLTNTGTAAWNPETGLLSIWILGMYNPSPATTVVIPFTPGDEKEMGPRVNDSYFGKVPADRLVVRDNVLFFRADGQYRSKIGINPRRASEICGSFDAQNNVLTIVKYSKPASETRFVNSMWEIQKEPYAGDTVNSYNDGPPGPGKEPLGPFYELETSSPALALSPGASATHTHRTMHFTGPRRSLDTLARTCLGVGLDEIDAVFPKQ